MFPYYYGHTTISQLLIKIKETDYIFFKNLLKQFIIFLSQIIFIEHSTSGICLIIYCDMINADTETLFMKNITFNEIIFIEHSTRGICLIIYCDMITVDIETLFMKNITCMCVEGGGG